MERSGSKGTLVHFRCTNPAHTRPAEQRSDTLTLVEGLWAYCPFDIRAGDHAWDLTGGVPMQQLLSDLAGSLGQTPEEHPRDGQQADA
jgi:hypothetical protein